MTRMQVHTTRLREIPAKCGVMGCRTAPGPPQAPLTNQS